MFAREMMDAVGCDVRGTGDKSVVSFEHDLLLVGRDRDKVAFQRLFEHFAPRLKTYLKKLNASDELSDDLVQDVMVTIWKRAPQFDPNRAAASTWIYTIARNRRIDMYRRDRPGDVEFEEHHYTEHAPSGFDIVAGVEVQERVRKAIAQLPTKQADLLRVFYFEDKTHTEIADELDLPLGTVKSRLRLAMNKLRGLIPEQGL